MLNSIKSLYNSTDLPGEFLVTPLKSYHGFFAKKIEQNSGLNQIAWKVAKAVTGIFAYPVFGLLAAIGMLVKLRGIPSIKSHNRAEKATIDVISSGVNYSKGFAFHSSMSLGNDHEQIVSKEFIVTKQNIETMQKAINESIDSYTAKFKKVCVKSDGAIHDGSGSISVQLLINKEFVV